MILDSCILIDISRQKAGAASFVGGLERVPSVSVLTVTEVLSGVRNQRERRLFDRLFLDWNVMEVDHETAELAARWLNQYRPSHGLDIIDAIIAATARVHEVELITLNLKHFPMFPGLEAPY
ncbi:MAG: PIN domain-containing protein [Proteobacteria bacterium]|nr:PIN domain-containing protein [Pseudomonadota bacterium]